MAVRWSNEHMVAEYNVLQANAMAVDCMGQYALLAGRRQLALVDLDQPMDSVRKFSRQSKWEISAVQWNPHSSHRHIFASACNQRVDICQWADSTCSVQGTLKAHTRIISDLDWYPTDPNILSTCSVDTFTYLWDMRDYRRPVTSFQAVAGASQVKWNKLNSYRMATTHDGDIRIWDTRKGTSPVQYIAGHLSKIYGLDWSPANEYYLATSSQDCHVKFWDVTNPRQPESKLTSGSPVWRARYTPFGRGLVTVVVPQWRRGENSLFLWRLDELKQPVHTFVGHTDVVLEFQWRMLGEGSQDYQLVTWSKDQTLRLWRIEPQLQKLCGHDVIDDSKTPPGMDMKELTYSVNNMSSSHSDLRKNEADIQQTSSDTDAPSHAHHPNMSSTPPMSQIQRREEIQSPHQPKTLKQEFSLVNIYIPNVTVDEMDAIKRTFTVTARSGSHSVTLTMSFPERYPNDDPPRFSIEVGKKTTIDNATQAKLIKVLRDTSLQQVKHHRSCIEPCLRQLVSSLDTLVVEDMKTPDSDGPYNLQAPTGLGPQGLGPTGLGPPGLGLLSMPPYFGSYQDASVPFPRTSGARFCSTGNLVCFTRRVDSGLTRRTSSGVDLTPRALSALSAFTHTSQSRNPSSSSLGFKYYSLARSPPSDNSVSVSNYYNYKDRSPLVLAKPSRTMRKVRNKENIENRSRESGSSPKKQLKTGPVIIYNIACLLSIHKQLGENYVINMSDPVGMCTQNASVAATAGRMDLVKIWSLAAMGTSSLLKPDPDPDLGAPWAFHPFGKNMLQSLIDHYSAIHDVQTLAMLCCVFGAKTNSFSDNTEAMVPVTPTTPRVSSEQSIMGTHKRFIITPTQDREVSPRAEPISPSTTRPYNPYHTIHPSDTSLRGWNFTIAKVKRSNSWSEMCEGYPFEDRGDPAEIERERHKKLMEFLDPVYNAQFEQFKQAYADILYSWQLLNKRAEILKTAKPKQRDSDIEFRIQCQCGAEVAGPRCHSCHKLAFQCAICHISVKGASSFCLSCGHGGHTKHILQWFQSHDVCPTGCGCHCQQTVPPEGPS